MVAIGMPDTNTRGLGTVGIACPPCAQMHDRAHVQNRSRHRPQHLPVLAQPDHRQCVTLMATVGPISVIVAPCPLLM